MSLVHFMCIKWHFYWRYKNLDHYCIPVAIFQLIATKIRISQYSRLYALKNIRYNETPSHKRSSEHFKLLIEVLFFILVYHISFKKYEDHNIERQTVLVYLTIIDVSMQRVSYFQSLHEYSRLHICFEISNRPYMTSFNAYYYNYHNALHTICQISWLSLWSIGSQPFILVWLPARMSKFSSKWCVRNVLVWDEYDDILTASTHCILGVVVTGIEWCHLHQSLKVFLLVIFRNAKEYPGDFCLLKR